MRETRHNIKEGERCEQGKKVGGEIKREERSSKCIWTIRVKLQLKVIAREKVECKTRNKSQRLYQYLNRRQMCLEHKQCKYRINNSSVRHTSQTNEEIEMLKLSH